MRPGPLLIRLLAFNAILALLCTIAAWFVWVVLACFVAIAIAAAIEAIRLRRVRIEAERAPKIALALDEIENTTLNLMWSGFSNPSGPVLRLLVRQRWPDIVDRPSTVLHGVIRAGEMLSLEMPLRGIARGSATIEPPAIAMTYRGLVERIVTTGSTSELHVLPNLKAVRRLHKRLNAFALRGLGSRTAPRIGKGREFDRLRDYVIDDDYRDIAWRASARHGRLIVREFRLDRSQEILLCLDQGHRMAARVAQVTRLDHAVNAAVLISYICNRMEDRVGIVSFDTEVDKGLAAGRGAAHLRAITSYVTSLEAAYRFTDYVAMASSIRRRLHHRTLLLMMTVLPEREDRFALLRAVEMLAPQHLPLIIVLSDPNLKAAAQFQPSNKSELSETLVARDLWLGRVELMRDLRARGALVVDSTPEDAGVDAVNAYIDVKRRQML
jgi:uncharacterized protein (DUF58 family)